MSEPYTDTMNGPVVFGCYALDPCARRLTRDGRQVDVQQQPLELLLLLVERADTIVTREMIRERLWPDTVVEYDQGINYAIRQIRIALGEEAYRLQTVPRRGYRFVREFRAQPLNRDAARTVVAAVGMVATFAAGILIAHSVAGVFIFEHLVHPYRCPYVQALVRIF